MAGAEWTKQVVCWVISWLLFKCICVSAPKQRGVGCFQTWLSVLTSSRCGRTASRLFSINSLAFIFMERSRTGQSPRRATTERDGEDEWWVTGLQRDYPNKPVLIKKNKKTWQQFIWDSILESISVSHRRMDDGWLWGSPWPDSLLLRGHPIGWQRSKRHTALRAGHEEERSCDPPRWALQILMPGHPEAKPEKFTANSQKLKKTKLGFY